MKKHNTTNAYEELEVQLDPFLTSALDRGEWSDSRPGRFTPGKTAPVIHWIEGWVGHKVGGDEKKSMVAVGNPWQSCP
jgi:hypothetical protein